MEKVKTLVAGSPCTAFAAAAELYPQAREKAKDYRSLSTQEKEIWRRQNKEESTNQARDKAGFSF